MFYLLALSSFQKKFITFLPLVPTRVEQPMSDHLSAQGRPDQRGGLHCFWSPNKTWTPLIRASDAQKIANAGLELKKLQPPKVEGSKTQKNKPSNTRKPDHPKTSLYVAIRVQRWFVKLKVTLVSHFKLFKMNKKWES
jgi:hypothetical protein